MPKQDRLRPHQIRRVNFAGNYHRKRSTVKTCRAGTIFPREIGNLSPVNPHQAWSPGFLETISEILPARHIYIYAVVNPTSRTVFTIRTITEPLVTLTILMSIYKNLRNFPTKPLIKPLNSMDFTPHKKCLTRFQNIIHKLNEPFRNYHWAIWG